MATAQSKGDPALQSAFTLPQLQADPLTAQVPSLAQPFATPGPNSAYGAQNIPGTDTSGEIVKQMMTEEYAFVRPALNAVKTCDQ